MIKASRIEMGVTVRIIIAFIKQQVRFSGYRLANNPHFRITSIAILLTSQLFSSKPSLTLAAKLYFMGCESTINPSALGIQKYRPGCPMYP
jgi:hypothetical protein